jgi:alcohol dehydrogenase class IV
LIGDRARSIGLPAAKRAAGVVTRLLPIPQPTLLVGPGSSGRLGQAVAGFGHRHLLVVTDAVVARLGLLKALLDALTAGGTPFTVFDEVTPDAPIPVIEKGIEVFKAAGADAIVAFGGGSVIDAAKVIGLAAANDRHPRSLVGYFRALHGPPPIYAVPTTAGTGSEVTVAAVISDPVEEKKLVIADTRIVPRMAALDPALMVGLPKPVTAATGMDALTHAVEAYLGYWNTAESDRMALAATAMIFENLPLAYDDGANLAAREKMALASTYAGLAFTRANVGNVHAIAHQLGARYHTPHGLANAIMLPQVLRFSLPAATGRLADLAVRAGVGHEGEPAHELAERFLEAVDRLAAAVGIPRRLDALREEDIPALAEAACWEADTNYPVPRRMTQADCEAMLRAVLPESDKAQDAERPRAARRQRKAASKKVAKTPRRKPTKAARPA